MHPGQGLKALESRSTFFIIAWTLLTIRSITLYATKQFQEVLSDETPEYRVMSKASHLSTPRVGATSNRYGQ